MKQKDIALYLVIVFVSGMFSYFLSSYLISSPKNRQEKVEVVQPISAELSEPDDKYFNQESVNLTQQITIGTNSNNQPFNQQQ